MKHNGTGTPESLNATTLTVHKEKLEIVYIANEFVKGCEHHQSIFGKFN